MGAVHRTPCSRLARVLLLVSILAVPGSRRVAAESAPTTPAVRYPVALLQMYDGVWFFQKMGSITYDNKRRYAARHGYDMVAHNPEETVGLWKEVPCEKDMSPRLDGKCYAEDDSFQIDKRAPTFGKIKLALAACVGRDNYWLLWSDADALITNHSIPLTDLIDERYDIILTVDWLMINAGVMLLKCSPWNIDLLQRVYDAREFDTAGALDQSALDHFFQNDESAAGHIKRIPKHALNVYAEEYRPGDFLVHCAGKLYESTELGAVNLINQFNAFSFTDDIDDIRAFFDTHYLLNSYSGTCDVRGGEKECPPTDPRRLKLPAPLKEMAQPDRYKHVGLRYSWMKDWKDQYDVPGWNDDRVLLKPIGANNADAEAEPSSTETTDPDHEEL